MRVHEQLLFYVRAEPGKSSLLIGAGIATRVLAEIKVYLMLLKGESNRTLLEQIEKFTQSFVKDGVYDFSNFNIDNYIGRINAAVGKKDDELTGDSNYSIAMPPEAVADYLRRNWDCNAEAQRVTGGFDDSSEGIIGVKDEENPMPLYDGLCHYMYQGKDKRIYSWGDDFDSVAEAGSKAGSKYRVCWFIKIMPN